MRLPVNWHNRTSWRPRIGRPCAREFVPKATITFFRLYLLAGLLLPDKVVKFEWTACSKLT
jgi:hypothetical protein